MRWIVFLVLMLIPFVTHIEVTWFLVILWAFYLLQNSRSLYVQTGR